MKKTNIIFIGMSGSGKTTIGKKIAKILSYNFFDLDKEVELALNKSITHTVEEKGWDFFRHKEAEICKLISQKENAVIAAGGGTVLNQKNVTNMKKNGFIILLLTTPEILIKRRSNHPKKSHRPPLHYKNLAKEIKSIWKEREKKYFAAADLIYQVDDSEPVKVSVENVMKLLGEKRILC